MRKVCRLCSNWKPDNTCKKVRCFYRGGDLDRFIYLKSDVLTKIKSLEGTVNGLKSAIDPLKKDNKKLKTKVGKLEISYLKTKIKYLESIGKDLTGEDYEMLKGFLSVDSMFSEHPSFKDLSKDKYKIIHDEYKNVWFYDKVLKTMKDLELL